MEFLVPLVLVVLLWFAVILPQQRRIKAHKAFADSIKVGDEVITTAGLYGEITDLSDDRVRLEIAPGVEITVARLAVGERQDGMIHQSPEPDTETAGARQASESVSPAESDDVPSPPAANE